MPDIAVSLVTLESRDHLVGDIERGVKDFQRGGVTWRYDDEFGMYIAWVPRKSGVAVVMVDFQPDGQDVDRYSCHCTMRYKNPPVCRHVVAAVLAIQGGVVESAVVLGRTGTATTTVTTENTAKTIGSGDLDVFATPMMVALIEQAACQCLGDCLDDDQTSVGVAIEVEHTSPSPLGATITASVVVSAVHGRRVVFDATVTDQTGQIGSGTHTRVIVNQERFLTRISSQ